MTIIAEAVATLHACKARALYLQEQRRTLAREIGDALERLNEVKSADETDFHELACLLANAESAADEISF
ncbi:hypothetical protein [Paraburkholderia sacchari]|uniref:Uncharacterized protein n=1 Tax=Paraburkholderia sacchari TaxID=159450 RepID=A0A8T6ZI67_9BURK|nr:hypothetical protein [Paraburkholderia sacchari]NLP64355.1 hypothetical protein [Paraburkholderia sacchari]